MTGNKFSRRNLRNHPRIGLRLSGEFRLQSDRRTGTPKPFETEDVSMGGLKFNLTDRIEKGSVFRIRLFLRHESVEFTAKVIWVIERAHFSGKQTPFTVGLQYLKISPEIVSKINQLTWE